MRHFLVLLFIFSTTVLSAQAKIDTLSLYYENDTFELRTDQLTKLDSLNFLSDEIDKIVVMGYANKFASASYNFALSEKRARTVKNKLSDIQFVSAKGYGEINTVNPIARRVDLLIYRANVIQESKSNIPIKMDLETEIISANVGDKVVLDGILFVPGLDIIRPESENTLNILLDYMEDNPNAKIRILGHVCCGYNGIPSTEDGRNNRTGEYTLSTDRAQKVFAYLVAKGIPSDRMTYKGMAFMEPLGRGDKFDRRVEIEIIAF